MNPLWITYAWVDNAEGDFDFLVSELRAAGIETTFDRVALVPGQRLWAQIDSHINRNTLAGWAHLVTEASLASEPCKEELAYALNQALQSKGAEFPIIGLVSGVPMRELPQALSTRLCIDLGAPDWVEQVKAALEHRPPAATPTATTPYRVSFQKPYQGDSSLAAIEIAPRFGELRNWRIAFPGDAPDPVIFGSGLGPMGGISMNSMSGTITIDGREMKWVGTGDPINPSRPATVVFRDYVPVEFAFGVASGASPFPSDWTIFTPKPLRSEG